MWAVGFPANTFLKNSFTGESASKKKEITINKNIIYNMKVCGSR